jgi:hypothetical protein
VGSIEVRHLRSWSPNREKVRAALVAGVAFALCLPAVAAASDAPLPESDYTTRPLCAPPAPGEATCLASELVPRTAAARARTHPLGVTLGSDASPAIETGAYGLSPDDLRSAYFPDERPDAPVGEPQTIALVDAYADPEAETDLSVYSEKFGLPVLPPCTSGAVSDCFEQVNQSGETGNLPVPGNQREVEMASQWAGETSIDIEVAHGICRNCRILLVDASVPLAFELEAAVGTAEQLGATEISNSWTDWGEDKDPFGRPFNDPGIVITAGSGDWGYENWMSPNEYESGVNYPASSPSVIAVGGTKLTVTEAGARASETVWNDGGDHEKNAGGGGCSGVFSAPSWQTAVPDWDAVGCGTGEQSRRAVADVAADADPDTGVAIYDSVPYYYAPGSSIAPGWVTIGGTSVASPIVASLFALVGGSQGVEYPAATLYSHLGGASLYDVTSGGNGKCDGVYSNGCAGSMSEPPLSLSDCGKGVLICNAGPGYDGPTGVGAPAGLAAFEAGSEAGHAKRVATREAAAKKAEEEQRAAEKKVAEERKREEERLAAEQRPERERLAAEQKAEEEQKKAAEKKVAEERKREEEGQAAERKAAEERKDEEAQKAAEAQARAVRQDAEAAEQHLKLAEEEWRKAADEEGLSGKGNPSGRAVRLTGLGLTVHARTAIAGGQLTLSQLAFAFDLSASARVRVTLSRLLTAHGHRHWVLATGALTLTAARGHDQAHLRGDTTLARNPYRLTLTPLDGAAQSIVFVIGVRTSG